jgi:hypothetical protein
MIGRKIEDERAVFRQTAVQFAQRKVLIYATVAQDVCADYRRKSTIWEWQFVEGPGTDWASALGGCAHAGVCVDIEPDHISLGARIGEPSEESPGAATCIQCREMSCPARLLPR